MRYVLILIFATIAGYGVLQIDKLDPDNYVKMYIGSYVIEIKVLGFLLLTFGLVIALYFVIRLLRLIWKAPTKLANWRERRVGQKADASLGAGYLSLIKGDWSQAEKQLTTKTEHSTLPYINYLAAAQAAQEQGQIGRRDEYLNAAYKAAPKERLAIGLIKARLHQNAGQMDQALATLHDLSAVGAKNAQYTAMLMQTYEEIQDWRAAQDLLPTARKQKALPEELLSEIQDEIHSSALAEATDLDGVWGKLPRDQKRRPINVLVYTQGLVNKGESDKAEKLIRATLKTSWSDDLIRLYGKLPTDKPAKLLRRVDGWLLARPENAELNLAAGRLAMAEKDFDAAKAYLQKAIQEGRLPAAYALLGEAFEASNESGKALQLYRSGMLAAADIDEAEVESAKPSGRSELLANDRHTNGDPTR